MPRFKGHLTRTFTTRARPEQVCELLSNPRTWIDHQEEIEHTEDLGNNTLQVRLREHQHGPAKFQAVYRCTWQRLPDGARWDSEDGANFAVHGRVRVRGVASGSEVTWDESVEADVPVPRLMVRVVRPVAERLMSRGIAKFIEQMNAELDRQAG